MHKRRYEGGDALGKPARLHAAYPLALLLTWVIHDTEELRDLRTFEPPVRVPFSREAAQEHMNRGVKVMGGMMLALAGVGTVSGGRHALFRAAVRANVFHALWHIGATAALGRKTPGVWTAAGLVLPATLLTERALGRAKVPPPPAGSLALFPAALVTAHTLAWAWGRTSARQGDDSMGA
ncbi:hypothetical protein GCM10017783_10580 [Deinococcus piscis]|uniref:HXXEE domain-containing protein n=1 Tax=Deinococcus piscis TaxID=394230 RepID=A0ABQ3K1S6_9DEIO|nr:HXXEE domain-containing protein [Deinococcus piscis]GHG00332.1 hypothetical protein GCM10017783_10580 [Deinococcus piscis]